MNFFKYFAHLLLVFRFQEVTAYLQISHVLAMLNIPWEGKCPVTPYLQLHPQLTDLGWVGRCPTVYRVLELPPTSEPSAILEGFCDPTCHNTVCGAFGDFRCSNFTVPVDITAVHFSENKVSKVARRENISVACVCQYRKSTKLRSSRPLVVV